MKDRVTINARGAITIPVHMREIWGLKPNDQMVIETNPQELLLRPTVNISIELYTDHRIAEFTRDDDAIAKKLKDSAV
jgi:AbrB family looped-hinge helix DNA binding protein